MALPRQNLVTEGMIEIGPRDEFFTFVDGEMLGRMIIQHSGVESTIGEYTKLGRARITVEWLDEGDSTDRNV